MKTIEPNKLLESIENNVFYLRNIGELRLSLDEDDITDYHDLVAHYIDEDFLEVEYIGKKCKVPCDIHNENTQYITTRILAGFMKIITTK